MAHDRERLRGEQAASRPAHPTLLQRLADNCYRHRQSVLGAWVLLLVALVSISSVGEFDNDFDLPVLAIAAVMGVVMTMLAAGTVRADRPGRQTENPCDPLGAPR